MLFEIHQASVQPRLQPFSTQVPAGQMIHLLGPNGAGKSTLLAMLSGLQPYQGSILLDGQEIAKWDRRALALRRSWLHQQQTPCGQMPVFLYLQQYLPLALSAQVEAQVGFLCQQLKLSDKLTKSVSQLSGGEWQRVRLAGVLLQCDPQINPQGGVLLLDEPLTGLDVAQQQAVEQWLTMLCQRGLSVIMSGHDLNHSLQYANTVWLLKNGQLVAQGLPDTLLQPDRLADIFDVPFRRVSLAEGDFLLRQH